MIKMKSSHTVKHLIKKLYAGICIALARRISSHYRPKASHHCSFKHTKFALLISRPHDIELLIDIYHYSLKRSDIEVIFWITNQALIRFPSTKKLMDEEGIQPTFIISHGRLIHAISYLLNIDALLTTVESTVASHKIPYIITKMANACGVRTYTMQHAFENVGLTYQDRELGPNVHFAAPKVLTWGPVDQLPSLVTTETRRKCLTVGCPKVSLTGLQKQNRGNSDPPIIAVFEGLQNKRFDEKYMSSFFNNLQQMACKFSGLRFILKPHPGVMTRSKRHTAFLHSMQHIEVLDPGASRLPLNGKALNSWPTPWLQLQHLRPLLLMPP